MRKQERHQRAQKKKKKIEYTGITRSGFFAGSISRSVLPSSSSWWETDLSSLFGRRIYCGIHFKEFFFLIQLNWSLAKHSKTFTYGKLICPVFFFKEESLALFWDGQLMDSWDRPHTFFKCKSIRKCNFRCYHLDNQIKILQNFI